jgi:hypothetical protein
VALTFYEDIFISDVQENVQSKRMDKADAMRNNDGDVGMAW